MRVEEREMSTDMRRGCHFMNCLSQQWVLSERDRRDTRLTQEFLNRDKNLLLIEVIVLERLNPRPVVLFVQSKPRVGLCRGHS